MIVKQRSPITEPTTLFQILHARGIPNADIARYTLASIETDVNSPLAFGGELMESGLKMLIGHINNNDKTLVVVDCDVDGNTSAALLLNYLYKLFPAWVENQVDYCFHEGKQHGLNDVVKTLNGDYKFIICNYYVFCMG